MRSTTFFFILLSFAIATSAASLWNQGKRADGQSTLEFRLALKQRNVDILEFNLLDTADPSSFSYGVWWTREKVLQLISPSRDEIEPIIAFLKKEGFFYIRNYGDMIKATGFVSDIETTFDTQLYEFYHSRNGRTLVRAPGSYSLPPQLRECVQFLVGLFELPKTSRAIPFRKADKDAVNVIPQLIQEMYSIPSTPQPKTNSSLCLAEFQDDQSFSKNDLSIFSKKTDTPLINVSHIVGPFDPSDPDMESSLDVQYGGAIASAGNDVWFWTVGGWMLEFSQDIFLAAQAPYVVNMSWGWPEPNQCEVGRCGNVSSYEYVSRVNVEFMKIGMRGITLLAASGDQGAAGDENPNCDSQNPLSTIFPGASPYVLSIGATMLGNITKKTSSLSQPPICSKFPCANVSVEVACSYPTALITTGGGFSNYSPMPAWQAGPVNSYLNSGIDLPSPKFFNSSNRGFPDVSALGHMYLIVADGEWVQVDGTSCSSPVLGGMIARLNNERFQNGKTSLGFINPLIYQAYATDPTIFTDISQGDNKCTESCCSKVGYLSTKGWDPVTGLGTPNFSKLAAYVNSLK